MGKRGPRRTPTSLKLLQGETRPSRLRSDPEVEDGFPDMPEHFVGGPEEVLWWELLGHLAAMNLVARCDGYALACLVSAITQYRVTAPMVKAAPLIRGRDGNLVRNPAWFVHLQAMKEIRSFCGEFGLTPSARVGLGDVAAHTDESFAAANRLLS